MTERATLEWIDEWPTRPGWYWFYGQCFGDRTGQPEFHYVKVTKTSNSIAYLTGGHFLYPSEHAEGVWQPVVFPALPAP